MLITTLLFCFILSSSSNAIPHQVLPRIVGGEEVEEHEFPFQISLQFLGNHICGGTLINLSTIVTTASCAELGSTSYEAVAGRHRLSSNESSSSQSLRISRVILHTGYPGASGYSNDIAVLKVLTPFQQTEYVQPIEINPNGNYSGIATISGFGSLYEGGGLSDVLMKVDVPIIPNQECNILYGQENPIEDSMMCAGEPGKDSCTGDNGGPLTIDIGNGTRYLIGLSSWGIGCGRPGYPGVYTEITYFENFINMYS